MITPSDIAIVIVGMNTRAYVRDCLASLATTEWGEYTHQIVYIDNASRDDTVEVVRREFPAVRILENQENVGFCRAANQGSAAVSARYLIHLNNDTLVYPDSLPQLARFLDGHLNVTVAGCRLLNHDLTDQWSARRFPGGIHSIWGRRSFLAKRFPEARPVRDYLFKDLLRQSEPFKVDWVGTPCMMVRSDVFQAVGGFPADFYYWHEAIFCQRVLRASGSTWVVPTSKVVHFEGKGGGARSYEVRRWHILDFHRGAYRFHVESHRLRRLHPRRWIAATGLSIRAVLLLIANWLGHRVLHRSVS
jgi:GT2 family glycosyltransferase